MVAKIRLISLNAFFPTSFHLNFTLPEVKFVKGANVFECLSHIPQYYFTKLINLQTTFQEVIGIMFLLLTFLLMGITPSSDTQKPEYSFLVCHNKYFSLLYFSPLYFSFIKVSSNFCTLSVQSNFAHIKRSYIYARIN